METVPAGSLLETTTHCELQPNWQRQAGDMGRIAALDAEHRFCLACGMHRSGATKRRWHDPVTPMADVLKLGERRLPGSHGPRERTACPNHAWDKATIQGLDPDQRRRILGMDRHGLAASPWCVSLWPGASPDHSSAMGDALGGRPRAAHSAGG